MTTLTFQRPADIDSRRVRVSLIDIPSKYEGKDSLVEDDAVRKSIAAVGVQQSVMLAPNGNRFTVIKGVRRVRIAQLLGLHDIPAIVNAEPSNRLRFILTQCRQDLFPSQRARFIKELLETVKIPVKDTETGRTSTRPITQKEIAAMLGVDAGSITNWLSIDRYIPAVVKAIDSNEITMHHARAFDGMTTEGQERVWKAKRKDIPTLSGGQFHRLVRSTYSPKNHAAFYVAPEKTIEKMSRKRTKRSTRSRPKLSRNEKDVLSRDLNLREVELTDSKEELAQLKREITLATQPIRAILRNKELLELIPDEMREELERFGEVYV